MGSPVYATHSTGLTTIQQSHHCPKTMPEHLSSIYGYLSLTQTTTESIVLSSPDQHKSESYNLYRLCQCSTAVKRHHKSEKQRHLIGFCLLFQRHSPLSSWWEHGLHTGRHDNRDGSESFIFSPSGSRQRARRGLLNRQNLPPLTHLLQHGHIS